MAGLQLRNICEAEKKEVRTWIRQRKQRFASQQRKALKENSQIFLFLWQDCQRCCFSSLISSRQILNLSVTSNLQLLTLDVDQAASLPLTKKKADEKCYQRFVLSQGCLGHHHALYLTEINILYTTRKRLPTREAVERCKTGLHCVYWGKGGKCVALQVLEAFCHLCHLGLV